MDVGTYIVLRDCSSGESSYSKGELLRHLEGADPIPDSIRHCWLRVDSKMFATAYQSSGFSSWIKEFARDIDENNNPLYPGLTKNAEALILYLKDLGIPTGLILKGMQNQEDYLNFLVLVDQFGQIIVE